MKSFFLLLLAMLSSKFMFCQAKINEAAPAISLPDMTGEIINLSSYKGKVVLLDFWASWCGPCRRNNPHLVKFYKKYHPKGLEILSVSIDSDQDAWKAAVKHDKLEWAQVNDNKGWDASSATTYGVDAIPASFLIDRNGIVHSINHVGWQLELDVKDLLSK
ncbi:MAG TPA: TlpA disulfide reductase family protein [Puia sp.]|nr:TlpA disulfide reductase family protein [Puia sp.]